MPHFYSQSGVRSENSSCGAFPQKKSAPLQIYPVTEKETRSGEILGHTGSGSNLSAPSGGREKGSIPNRVRGEDLSLIAIFGFLGNAIFCDWTVTQEFGG